MSAVLESLPASPVAAARTALESAQAQLGELDRRIRACEQELEERELARRRHVVVERAAILANEPRPTLKLAPSDAEQVLPILRESRKEFAEREADARGMYRRALVQEVERRDQHAQDTFAERARSLTDAWRELIGIHALLDQAGVTAHPLPAALTSSFSIPAFGRLRPIAENHYSHFMAEHSLAQGEGLRATAAARAAIERELGMTLPW